MQRTKETYYSLLGVGNKASEVEIRQAFKKLAFKWHPDKNIGKEVESTEIFRRVSEAYEVLKDRERRLNYDAQLEAQEVGSSKGFSSYTYNNPYNNYEVHVDPFRMFHQVFAAARMSASSPRFRSTFFTGFFDHQWETPSFNTQPEHGSPKWNVRISSGYTDTEDSSSDEGEQEMYRQNRSSARFAKPNSQRFTETTTTTTTTTTNTRTTGLKRKRDSTAEVIIIEESSSSSEEDKQKGEKQKRGEVIIIDDDEQVSELANKKLRRNNSQDNTNTDNKQMQQDTTTTTTTTTEEEIFLKSRLNVSEAVPEELTINNSNIPIGFLRSSADLPAASVPTQAVAAN